MIDPETDDVVTAVRTLALADSLGNSVTTEEAHAQAQALLIDIDACRNGPLKVHAALLATEIKAFSNANSVEAPAYAERVRAQAEDLRGLLDGQRKGLALEAA